MKKTSPVLVSLVCLLLLANGVELSEQEGGGGHGSSNSTDAGGHHGVSLASWRWGEYSTTILFTLMIMLASAFKVGFHHIPILPHYVPESCVLIILGCVAGGIINNGITFNVDHPFPKFTSELFFNVLLPPVILDSAFSLYDREFLSNLGPVLLFAIVGTLLNIFVIGFILSGLFSAGLMGNAIVLSTFECLIFSSLISAVDPVAVLAIFEEIGVNMGLYFLVFGESLLNDGVTVVIYNTMKALDAQEGHISVADYVTAVFSFFFVAGGGFIVGVIFGMMSAFLLRFTKHSRVIEPILIISFAYFAFVLAETIHWSGIIALIGCGIVQKRYASPNASAKTRTTVKYGVQTLSSVSDAIIFLFLGIVVISPNHDFEWAFVLWTLFLCLFIRFISVFGLSTTVNYFKVKPISLKEQFIMAYGGLRGAVGFSLAVLIADDKPYKNMVVTTTIIVIFFTVFIQGSTIKLFVNKLQIQRKATKDRSVGKFVNNKLIDQVMAGVEAITGHVSKYTILKSVEQFDANYVKKILINKGTLDVMQRKLQSATMDEHYARLYGPTVLVTGSKLSTICKDGCKDSSTVDTSRQLLDPEQGAKPVDTKSLKKAFRNTPFELYNRRFNQKGDSTDDILTQLDQKKKTASLIGRQIVEEDVKKLTRSLSSGESDADLDKRVAARMRWGDAGSKSASIALIKKEYADAKIKIHDGHQSDF